MKILFAVKIKGNCVGRKVVSSSEQHIQFMGIDISVMFLEEGVQIKIVEPISLQLSADPIEDGCAIRFDKIPEGSEEGYKIAFNRFSPHEICTLFGCAHPQRDTSTRPSMLRVLEIRMKI